MMNAPSSGVDLPIHWRSASLGKHTGVLGNMGQFAIGRSEGEGGAVLLPIVQRLVTPLLLRWNLWLA